MAEAVRLRRWLESGAAAVGDAREQLDAINVFPVADSDTGTNLFLTLTEGTRAVALLPADASHDQVVSAFERACLMGARGNSGVIVSQYLSAFLRSIDADGGLDTASAEALAHALELAAVAAFDAVGDPVDGTILSVARAAAEGGRGAADVQAPVEAAAVGAVAAARAELARTHDVLAVAREAGVVDAGAAGLVLHLERLAESIAGPDALAAIDKVDWEVRDRVGDETPADAAARHYVTELGSGAYEVMFVAHTRLIVPDLGSDEEPVKLKKALKAIGDSVAVTGVDDLWQAHVHTDQPEMAIAVAKRAQATQMVVRNIKATHAADRASVGMVAITTCPGLAMEVSGMGAAVLVVPDPMAVDGVDLARVVKDASGARVVIAAGAPALHAAAEAIRGTEGLPAVAVIDSTTEPQMLAAMAAAAMSSREKGPEPEMVAAAARTVAARSTVDALADDLDRLVKEETEIATIILGASITPGVAETATRRLAARAPGVEVHVFQGRQIAPAVILGVESMGA